MKAKTPTAGRNLGVRLDAIATSRLERFRSKTGIDGVTLARLALLSALDTYEREGQLTLPLVVVSESAFSETARRPARERDPKPGRKMA